MLKAVLALRAVPYPPTHNLALLLDLLREHGILFPLAFEDIRRLTPFAAELRYEDLPEELERPFDRSWLTELHSESGLEASPTLEVMRIELLLNHNNQIQEASETRWKEVLVSTT